MALNGNTLDKLKAAAKARDRTKYYEILVSAGDPYGALALGVVKQSTMSGRVARNYAIAVSKRYCRPIDDAVWLRISERLMDEDLAARERDNNFDAGTPSLTWRVIRDYHVVAFREVASLPPETWTAYIPLVLQGEDKGAKLWRRMLTENFIDVAVQTVWMVLFHRASRAGLDKPIQRNVLPTLTLNPPVATGQSDPRVDACMAALAQWQLPGSGASDRERLAVFYLSVLATDPANFWRLPGNLAPELWRDRPALVSPAY